MHRQNLHFYDFNLWLVTAWVWWGWDIKNKFRNFNKICFNTMRNSRSSHNTTQSQRRHYVRWGVERVMLTIKILTLFSTYHYLPFAMIRGEYFKQGWSLKARQIYFFLAHHKHLTRWNPPTISACLDSGVRKGIVTLMLIKRKKINQDRRGNLAEYNRLPNSHTSNVFSIIIIYNYEWQHTKPNLKQACRISCYHIF